MTQSYTQDTARKLAFLMMAGVFGLLWGFFGFLGGMPLVPAGLLVIGGAVALGYGVRKTPKW